MLQTRHFSNITGREEESSGFSSLVKALSKETLVLSFENALTSMTHAIKAGGQLACYAAIAMTSIGTRLVSALPTLSTIHFEGFCWLQKNTELFF